MPSSYYKGFLLINLLGLNFYRFAGFRYKKDYLMFNDDIQGTAATVLAGLYGAMKVQGESPEHLKNQRIVVAGAGSAGSGVILTIRNAIHKRYGLSKEEASSRFYIVDKDGLISKHR